MTKIIINPETPRMGETIHTNANHGIVSWMPVKSFWYLSHLVIAVVGGAFYSSLSAVTVFVLFTGTTLCFGHSLGMHRRLIHNSYECPLWLEYMFVYLGVLVGMAGPMGMTYQHDLRDWAQRQRECHPYLRHGESFLTDGWWQLNCDLALDHPPSFLPEVRLRNDRFYQLMEKTWMLQQIPWAIVLFYLGGISWVIWGVSARIAVSNTGHWLIGHFAHNTGERDWHVDGAAVQGHNIRFASLITMGESWHNNHHAFPGSAMLGIYNGQSDPGWWVLNRLINMRLVWNVKLPQDLSDRTELQCITSKTNKKAGFRLLKGCSIMERLFAL